MKAPLREPRSGLVVSRLCEEPDQGWGIVVASYVRSDWPPPAWLPLVGQEEVGSVCSREVIAEAS